MSGNDLIKVVEPEHSGRGLWGTTLAIYFMTTLFGAVALAIIDTIFNRYYGVNGSSPTYVPFDKPMDIRQIGCSKPIIGGHYFGDFQSEYCRMRGVTPYSSDVPSSYSPGFYVLLSSISIFTSVFSGWVATTTLSVLFLITTIKTKLGGTGALTVSVALLSVFNPFWQAIDRGNFSWLLATGLVILCIKPDVRSERSWLLAVSVSAKIQFAPFLILLLFGGTIRDKWRTLLNFATVFCLLNFILPIMGWRDFGQFYRNYFHALGLTSKVKNYQFDFGFKTFINFVTQMNWSIWFWVFYILFCLGLVVCLVLINASDRLLDEFKNEDELVSISLFASSIIVLFSPLSYAYSLMVLLVPTVLIVGLRSRARLINKVQLILVTICVLPNPISLSPFVGRTSKVPVADLASFPSLENLVPSLLLPSVALSAVVIGFVNHRPQKILK